MAWQRSTGKTITLFLLLSCVGLPAAWAWRDRLAFEVGYAYAYGNFHGVSLPRDDTLAEYWLRKAAEGGHPRAQYMLGLLHAHGWGTEHDDVLAVQWFKLAAAHDYAPAAFHLAWMYHKGEGVAADRQRALRLMRQAAGLDMAAAQLALGRFHEKGEGVPADAVQAMQWYRMAEDTSRRNPHRFDNASIAEQADYACKRLAALARQNATAPGR